jgi:hypothetical protein
MIKKLVVALEVLKVGKRLNNPIPWKNAQAMAGILIALIPAGIKGLNTFFGMDIHITDEHINNAGNLLAGFLVSAYGLFTWWSTLATSNKVGVSSESKPDSE